QHRTSSPTPISPLTLPPPSRSTLFPYTTLFRSVVEQQQVRGRRQPNSMLKREGRGPGVLEDELVLEAAHTPQHRAGSRVDLGDLDRKSTRLNSSHRTISYAVFCLKKKKKKKYKA